jgi:uncharacterized protein (DUF433 family)
MKPLNLKPYRWIVSDPGIFGGKPVVKGTRLAVSFILNCFAEGMSVKDIEETYAPFPHEAVPEIMKLSSELLDQSDVAA